MSVRAKTISVTTLALVALFSACGTPTPNATTAPSTSATGNAGEATSSPPLTSPSATATPAAAQGTATPAPGTLAPSDTSALQASTAVRVTVAELNVRKGPSTTSERLATVDRGTVFVLDGYEPTLAEGYVWWRVMEVENLVEGELPPPPSKVDMFGGADGYMAIAKGSMPYVEALAPRCPATPDLANVSAMLTGERARCFADSPLTLTGTLMCGPCEWSGPPETYEPEWLAHESMAWLTVAPNVEWQDLRLHFPPELAPDGVQVLRETQAIDGSILRVVGHFNDPRSASCVIELYVGDDTSHPVADSYAAQACRREFVVERFDVLGIDTEYDPPF
jgi:hypothetical protein